MLRAAVFHIGCYRNARAVGQTAISIDLAFEVWCDRDNGPPVRIAVDEIVGHLVERTVQVIICRHVGLVDADQDLSIALLIAIEGEARALADENAPGADWGG